VRAAILILLLASIVSAADTSAGQAQDLYQKTDYTGAIAVLKQRDPDSRSLELLGQCYFQLGDFKKATEALEKAAAAAPSDSMVQTWLGRAWGERAETSFALTAPAYARKAREAFEKAVRLDPANVSALSDLSEFYVEAPGIMGGGIEKARALVPLIAKYDPAGAHLAEARVNEEKKQFGAAETELREAIRLAPGKVGPVLDLAQFLSRRGRYEESEQTFQQAAIVAPDSPRILFARGEALFKSKRNPAEARELLTQYLATRGLMPDDPPRWEATRLLKKAESNQ
jgi:tetratricopeptide (TPR) repeat protein